MQVTSKWVNTYSKNEYAIKKFVFKLFAPSLDLCHVTGSYSKPCQAFKMKFLVKLVNGLLTIFAKSSILDF